MCAFARPVFTRDIFLETAPEDQLVSNRIYVDLWIAHEVARVPSNIAHQAMVLIASMFVLSAVFQ